MAEQAPPCADRVDLIIAYLLEHRDEIVSARYGSVSFVYAGDAPLRVKIERSDHVLVPPAVNARSS